jgi:hypothetical protein
MTADPAGEYGGVDGARFPRFMLLALAKSRGND